MMSLPSIQFMPVSVDEMRDQKKITGNDIAQMLVMLAQRIGLPSWSLVKYELIKGDATSHTKETVYGFVCNFSQLPPNVTPGMAIAKQLGLAPGDVVKDSALLPIAGLWVQVDKDKTDIERQRLTEEQVAVAKGRMMVLGRELNQGFVRFDEVIKTYMTNSLFPSPIVPANSPWKSFEILNNQFFQQWAGVRVDGIPVNPVDPNHKLEIVKSDNAKFPYKINITGGAATEAPYRSDAQPKIFANEVTEAFRNFCLEHFKDQCEIMENPDQPGEATFAFTQEALLTFVAKIREKIINALPFGFVETCDNPIVAHSLLTSPLAGDYIIYAPKAHPGYVTIQSRGGNVIHLFIDPFRQKVYSVKVDALQNFIPEILKPYVLSKEGIMECLNAEYSLALLGTPLVPTLKDTRLPTNFAESLLRLEGLKDQYNSLSTRYLILYLYTEARHDALITRFMQLGRADRFSYIEYLNSFLLFFKKVNPNAAEALSKHISTFVDSLKGSYGDRLHKEEDNWATLPEDMRLNFLKFIHEILCRFEPFIDTWLQYYNFGRMNQSSNTPENINVHMFYFAQELNAMLIWEKMLRGKLALENELVKLCIIEGKEDTAKKLTILESVKHTETAFSKVMSDLAFWMRTTNVEQCNSLFKAVESLLLRKNVTDQLNHLYEWSSRYVRDAANPLAPVLDKLKELVDRLLKAEDSLNLQVAKLLPQGYGHENLSMESLQSYLPDEVVMNREMAVSAVKEKLMIGTTTLSDPDLKVVGRNYIWMIRQQAENQFDLQWQEAQKSVTKKIAEESQVSERLEKLIEDNDNLRADLASAQSRVAELEKQIVTPPQTNGVAQEAQAGGDIDPSVDRETLARELKKLQVLVREEGQRADRAEARAEAAEAARIELTKAAVDRLRYGMGSGGSSARLMRPPRSDIPQDGRPGAQEARASNSSQVGALQRWQTASLERRRPDAAQRTSSSGDLPVGTGSPVTFPDRRGERGGSRISLGGSRGDGAAPTQVSPNKS